MGHSLNVEITVTGGRRRSVAPSAAKTAAKVKAEDAAERWFHSRGHAASRAFTAGVWASLARLTQLYTAYSMGRFVADTFVGDGIRLEDGILRAMVAQSGERLPQVLSRLLPHGGVAFGVGRYFGEQVQSTWLLGVFDLDGRSVLQESSRFRLVGAAGPDVVGFRADVDRVPG